MAPEIIQVVTSVRPVTTISLNGDEWTVHRTGGIKEEEPFKYKHMQEVTSKGISLQKNHFLVNENYKRLYLFSFIGWSGEILKV